MAKKSLVERIDAWLTVALKLIGLIAALITLGQQVNTALTARDDASQVAGQAVDIRPLDGVD